jgi:hypothetical protein
MAWSRADGAFAIWTIEGLEVYSRLQRSPRLISDS